MFRKFAGLWNAGALLAMYYTGDIPDHVRSVSERSGHRWGFQSKLSEKEAAELQEVKDGVHALTESAGTAAGGGTHALHGGAAAGGRGRGRGGGGGGGGDEEADREQRRARRKERGAAYSQAFNDPMAVTAGASHGGALASAAEEAKSRARAAHERRQSQR